LICDELTPNIERILNCVV